MAREQRRLAAILAADVVGYSRLMGRDESGTLARLREHRKERFEPALTRNGGRLVKLTGDGALVEFASAVDALGAAIEFQQAMAEANHEQPEDTRIVFRIGLHLGDLIVDGGDLYGDGVNVAARLESEAPPGGIVISRTVHEAVDRRLKATFNDLGSLTLKNIDRPIQAFRVGWDTANWISPARKTTANPLPSDSPLALPDKPSIAVLAFTNMSGDPEQEYFADGISEDIITELSRFRELFVIARNSSFSYKGKSPEVRQVGRELGVRYVLEGSIRRVANRIRVTAQLIDATSGSHVWAERYDRVLEDIFAVQEEVTRAIVSALAPEIVATERSRSARRTPGDLSAYDKALRGWAHAWEGFEKGDRATLDRAMGEANDALTIDPDSVLALHAITLARSLEAYRNLATDREYSLHLAMEAAQRAVELDGADPVGYAMRAFCLFLSRNPERLPDGLADARRAHEMNSNDTFVLYVLANLEASIGDPERAIEQAKEVLRLNPRDSGSHRLYTLLAFACFSARRYAEGVDWALRSRNEKPLWTSTHGNLVTCLVGAGEIEKAKAAFDAARRIEPQAFQNSLSGRASAYARPADRERQRIFIRVAAGLEDPSAAEAVR